ncbi:hypothetical protein BV25DRAFT_592305 [Artomyces pyxidatus]|uniref:Uncharacterized protein n=1 Tax=Artomyces pyxidatus TaxID=48021 RepID=A0ACB8T3H1_9AGAM|nr:hypothetical protein BV25DRAFT_592305 [Artomyces pyxidatus]
MAPPSPCSSFTTRGDIFLLRYPIYQSHPVIFSPSMPWFLCLHRFLHLPRDLPSTGQGTYFENLVTLFNARPISPAQKDAAGAPPTTQNTIFHLHLKKPLQHITMATTVPHPPPSDDIQLSHAFIKNLQDQILLRQKPQIDDARRVRDATAQGTWYWAAESAYQATLQRLHAETEAEFARQASMELHRRRQQRLDRERLAADRAAQRLADEEARRGYAAMVLRDGQARARADGLAATALQNPVAPRRQEALGGPRAANRAIVPI